MSRFPFATSFLVVAAIFCFSQSAAADGFEPVGPRPIARWFGVGFGQGYHAVPCAKHLADHYNRSVQGIVHPAHRLTPVYHHNTPQSCRIRGRQNERAPYYVGNTMPPAHRPTWASAPTRSMLTVPYSTQPQPQPYPRASEYEADGKDTSDFETLEPELPEPKPLDADVELDKETRIQRLPAVADVDEPVTDGSQFDNVELDGTDEYPEAVMDPLRGHPLWEENGPARPRLFGDAASQSAP